MLIPIWNFERKLKMLNLCYLLHLFCILAITFFSKFQLIWDGCFWKENSILYNFSRNRENQISMFSQPKMRFKLLLRIITFFWAFFFFFFYFFYGSYLFLSSKSLKKKKKKKKKRSRKDAIKENNFIISLKKWSKMKFNKKSHLINFKLILVRINQN